MKNKKVEKRKGLLKLASEFEKTNKDRQKSIKSIALYSQKKGVFDRFKK